jgi:hypothetical protein
MKRYVSIVGVVLVASASATAFAVVGNGPSGQLPSSSDHFVWATNGAVKTNSTSFKPVRTMQVPSDLFMNAPLEVTVSSDMRGGAALFRVVADDPAAVRNVLYPSNALFSSPGSNSYTFIIGTGGPDLKNFRIEWKRVGRKPARAAHVTAAMTAFID